MPRNENNYPDAFKNFPEKLKKKAIEIANALLEEWHEESAAIPIAISQAKERYDNK